jgi:hypothetical protein
VSATQYRPEEPCGEGDAYFYDEYTCPSNWLGDVEVVIQGDSTDPHGIAQWVASIPLAICWTRTRWRAVG